MRNISFLTIFRAAVKRGMSNKYDVVILGAGVGGYVAAIRAAQLGMRVALVEKEKVGGVCLHQGCIPSKTLLKSAELYNAMKHSEVFGIKHSGLELDFSAVQLRKQQVVNKLYQGLQQLLGQYPIDLYQGTGRILGPSIFSPQSGTISVEYPDDRENAILIPQFVIIATGSRPRSLPNLEVDGTSILSSDHLLQLKELPSSVMIIGGGAIGVEWASLLSDLGVKVTIVEAADRILPFEDEEIALQMQRNFEKRGISIYTGVSTIARLREENGKTLLQIDEHQISAEKVVLSVGRKANVEDIGLVNTQVVIKKGCIEVNEYQQTAESHIYAVGDVVGGYQLAHVAAYEAIIAVEHMAGKQVSSLDLNRVPRCIYSRPEIGSIGYSEQEARELGFEVKVGKIPLRSIGKAVILGQEEGLIKMVTDRKTEDLLGVHMIGAQATELIAQAGISKFLDATAWELSQVIYPHPTLSEAFGEVSMAVEDAAIYSLNRKEGVKEDA